MVNVNIKSDGIKYLFLCLSKYMGNTAYVLLFFGLLIFILIYGNEKEKKMFIPIGITMVLTVYNPLFPVILGKITDISSEYYRFFWIAPILFLVPYCITKLVLVLSDENISDGIKKSRPVVCALILLVICISSDFLYKDGIDIAENIYKVPDELIEISEIIHKDCPDEYPKAFLEYEYNMQMRQYDPKMLLTIDREDYINAVTEEIPSEKVYDDYAPQYRILAAIVRGQQVETPNLLDGFELSKTEYVVLSKGNVFINRLEVAGLSVVAETENHIILKYHLNERKPFELVDYSDIYEKGL